MSDHAQPGRIYSRAGQDLEQAMLTPFPPVRSGSALRPSFGSRADCDWPATWPCPCAAWPMRSSGARVDGFCRLMSMPGQSHGFPVPVDGAGALTAAPVSRLQHRDGVLRCAERVASVVVRGGRAVGDASPGASHSVRPFHPARMGPTLVSREPPESTSCARFRLTRAIMFCVPSRSSPTADWSQGVALFPREVVA